MNRLAVALALLANPLAAQQVTVDSTFDVYSRTSRVWLASAPVPSDLPGLDMFVAARIVIGPSEDPAFRYGVTCAVWAGFEQAEEGLYWHTPRIPVELLIRRSGGESATRAGPIRHATVATPCRERRGSVVFRLTRETQAATAITAQLHGGADRADGAFMLEFPSGYYDAVREVLARADSSLMAASRANQARLTCR